MEGASQYFGSDDEEDAGITTSGAVETPAVQHGRPRRPFAGIEPIVGAKPGMRDISEMDAFETPSGDIADDRNALARALHDRSSEATDSRGSRRTGSHQSSHHGSGVHRRARGGSSRSGSRRGGAAPESGSEQEDEDESMYESGSGSGSGESSTSSKEQIDRMDKMSDQEIEKRGLSRRLSFRRKRLAEGALSYYESRESVLMLDYTPCICKRPIDLHTPLRVLR